LAGGEDEAKPMMEVFWQELTSGLHDSKQVTRVLIRLVAATLLGAIIGIQRERTRKPAGLRTHVLVSLATAAFVIAGSSFGMTTEGLSRMIQGIITGIGFIGAGSILKLSEQHQIKGLTTAASVWMTAAIGVTIGLGSLGIALMITVLAVGILALEKFEHRIEEKRRSDEQKV
jgi:putative Mg2+ transporter-C (MgtC) family protein